ncbi:MAG: sigma-70 family RNA polymerase sigma factor [Bacteroidales bacterium]|nr:sigma-70 family RNA polymerase sigma factor [Bacteroidales bacterium]
MALKVTWKKYREWTDEELTEQFRSSGDLEQLGVLYERYMHLVYGVCLKYLENREDAKDGVTAIFEKLITELPKHEVEQFRGWLYVLTKNHCLMKIRSAKSAAKRKESWENEQDIFMESADEMHPIDEEEQLLNKTLQECIKALKGQQQECVRLFYFENRSYREIATMLQLEEKKVKSFIQNGKRNLKICIEEKHGKTG